VSRWARSGVLCAASWKPTRGRSLPQNNAVVVELFGQLEHFGGCLPATRHATQCPTNHRGIDMLRKVAIAIALVCAAPLCNAQTASGSPGQPPSSAGVCLFTGDAPAGYTYTTLKELDYGKGSYGSVNDLLPQVVADAKAVGADAIIHYNGAQHFGFFPWRFVRPVVTGVAIKWTPARDVDCAGAGGHYTTGTLEEAPPPPAN